MHPITWVTWTAVVALAVTLTRNPLYLTILLGTVAINYSAASQRNARRRHRDRLMQSAAIHTPRGGAPPLKGDLVGEATQRSPVRSLCRHRRSLSRHEGAQVQGWRSLLRIALGLALLVIPFNALSAHAGSHVLFQLPQNWPLIGGNITLEAVIWGACTALNLLTLITLFATFNLRVNQAQMLRLTPSFIYEAGLIVSIALTFIPQMMISAREIREAQLIRGHKIHRVLVRSLCRRDMLPLLMALLTTGLERSFQLAESMEARGFGVSPSHLTGRTTAPNGERDILYKALTLLGLGGILSGLFMLTYSTPLEWAGWIGVVLSASLLLGVFWAQGRRVSRTHYRRDRWSWRDGAVLSISLLVVALLIAVRIQDAVALLYYPYLELLPHFQPWLAAALGALVAPALLAEVRRTLRVATQRSHRRSLVATGSPHIREQIVPREDLVDDRV